MPAEAASRRQVALLPNLRAHRFAALRGVRAHVRMSTLRASSLLRRSELRRPGMAAALPVEGRVLARLGWAGQTTDFFEHSLPLSMWGSSGALIGYWVAIFNRCPIEIAANFGKELGER